MAASAIKTFFSFSQFAVVGASSNPQKYGHKVFLWYKLHNLPVTPINPTAATVETPTLAHSPSTLTIPSVSALPTPTTTSVSIITPPKVTLEVLREAADAGVPAVWMQPGTYDDAVLAFAREEGRFQAVVVGEDAESGGEDGWCVLVDGERGLKAAGKL